MHIVSRDDAIPYTTRDNSEIRELAHPINSPLLNQSLAEATIAPGAATLRHYHLQTEEIYYILSGAGAMHLGEESRSVSRGDIIVIPPSKPHYIANIGDEPLVLLCCCSPAYSHEDTIV